MRILHTSDWHLGRQFYNQSLLEDQQFILEQICRKVDDLAIDVVIVAGDIYDRSVPPATAVELLDKTVSEICHRLKVPLIMISGNHDSPERLGFAARQLAAGGLYVVGTLQQEPVEITLRDNAGKQVAFYPIPYADPVTVRHMYGVEVTTHDQAMQLLVEKINKIRRRDIPSVAIAHCFLAGADSSESERPLAVGGAETVASEIFADFSYTALGHLHGQQYRHRKHIRYSGSPLKYSFSEEFHNKSCTLVDIDGNGELAIEQIKLQAKRNMRSLDGTLEQILANGKDDAAADDYLLVRLNDTHAILDIMNKLRTVYPNILHLERPGLVAGASVVPRSRHLQRGALKMFEDFFEQVTEQPLTSAQRDIVAAELELLRAVEDS
jgi:exonuclease SbcD